VGSAQDLETRAVKGVALPARVRQWLGHIGKHEGQDLRRRLLQHEACAREHAMEAVRCARMRSWDGYADHVGWQKWHDRQAHKLHRRLAVLDAEAWISGR
jgi:hypothetical protein